MSTSTSASAPQSPLTCQCEHAAHFDEGTGAAGRAYGGIHPTHPYGHECPEVVLTVRTVSGTFQMCGPCYDALPLKYRLDYCDGCRESFPASDLEAVTIAMRDGSPVVRKPESLTTSARYCRQCVVIASAPFGMSFGAAAESEVYIIGRTPGEPGQRCEYCGASIHGQCTRPDCTERRRSR